MSTQYLNYPLHFDRRSLTAETNEDDHIRDLIYLVLFTSPGERVNRPDFGCGLKQLIFMPNSDVLAAATQFMALGALQRWLETVIQVERVTVRNQDEKLLVTVVYRKLSTGEQRIDQFTPTGLLK